MEDSSIGGGEGDGLSILSARSKDLRYEIFLVCIRGYNFVRKVVDEAKYNINIVYI